MRMLVEINSPLADVVYSISNGDEDVAREFVSHAVLLLVDMEVALKARPDLQDYIEAFLLTMGEAKAGIGEDVFPGIDNGGGA